MYNDLFLDRLSTLDEAERETRINELFDEIESLNNLLSPEAQELIQHLRPHIVTDDVYEEIDSHDSLGDHIADQIAQVAGSWSFILLFCFVMLIWVTFNGLVLIHAFDPYPFILLNLALSTLAALQAPVILMSQNRQAEKDRAMADNDFQVNLKNEIEIADLHRKIDSLLGTSTMQQQMLNALVAARRQELSATVRAIGGNKAEVVTNNK